MPRNIDPAVNDLDDVYLYDIDALQALATEARRARDEQVAHCTRIIDEEVAREMGRQESRTGPALDAATFTRPTRDA